MQKLFNGMQFSSLCSIYYLSDMEWIILWVSILWFTQ